MVHRAVQQAKAELRTRIIAPLIDGAVIWGLVVAFGLTGVIFLYVLADRALTDTLGDPVAAAAILAGANVALVLVMLLARALTTRRR